jgi:hypothetical protein
MMTAIYQRFKQLQAQGMPQNQIAAVLQNSEPNMNSASLQDAEKMIGYMQSHPASVQPPTQDSVVVSLAKQIAAQDAAKKAAAQSGIAGLPGQQPLPGVAPQQGQQQAPQQAPQNSGIAGLPVSNVGNHYASGGIVAFDEGGAIENQMIAARMLGANQQPQQSQAPQWEGQENANQGDVDFAAAHGGPVRHYDGTDGSLVNSGNVFDSSQLFGTTPQSIKQSIASRIAALNATKAPDLQTLIDQMNAAGGYDAVRQNVQNQISNMQDAAQRQFNLAGGKGAAGAGMEAGEITAGAGGQNPNYAGQGLASILTTMNRNIGARAAAQAAAGKDLTTEQLEALKQGINYNIADEANRRNDIRYATGLEREGMRDIANERSGLESHLINLTGVEENAAARQQNAANALMQHKDDVAKLEAYREANLDPLKALKQQIIDKHKDNPEEAYRILSGLTPAGMGANTRAMVALQNDKEYGPALQAYNKALTTGDTSTINAQKAILTRIAKNYGLDFSDIGGGQQRPTPDALQAP